MEIDNNHPVMIRLNVGQVNRLLSLLGTHPYNTSADIIHAVKSQGDMQIAAAQAPAPASVGPIIEPDKPNPMPELVPEPTKEVVRVKASRAN